MLARLAQSVEHFTRNEGVVCSNHISSSKCKISRVRIKVFLNLEILTLFFRIWLFDLCFISIGDQAFKSCIISMSGTETHWGASVSASDRRGEKLYWFVIMRSRVRISHPAPIVTKTASSEAVFRCHFGQHVVQEKMAVFSTVKLSSVSLGEIEYLLRWLLFLIIFSSCEFFQWELIAFLFGFFNPRHFEFPDRQ